MPRPLRAVRIPFQRHARGLRGVGCQPCRQRGNGGFLRNGIADPVRAVLLRSKPGRARSHAPPGRGGMGHRRADETGRRACGPRLLYPLRADALSAFRTCRLQKCHHHRCRRDRDRISGCALRGRQLFCHSNGHAERHRPRFYRQGLHRGLPEGISVVGRHRGRHHQSGRQCAAHGCQT